LYLVPRQAFGLGQVCEQFEKTPGGVSAGYGNVKDAGGFYGPVGTGNEKLDGPVRKSFSVGNNLDIRPVVRNSLHTLSPFTARAQSSSIILFGGQVGQKIFEKKWNFAAAANRQGDSDLQKET
jgi:hypothetical protein